MSNALLLLLLFAAISTAALAIFFTVAWTTCRPDADDSHGHAMAYVIRRRWFLIVLLTLLVSFAASVPFFPYLSADAAMQPAMRVPVHAVRFYFEMPSQLPVDKRILFEVTSRDVNHGFGIYDPQNRLITQTQAMPDYTNYLAVTFHERGTYTVRCMEYCGIPHHVMEKQFTVGEPQ